MARKIRRDPRWRHRRNRRFQTAGRPVVTTKASDANIATISPQTRITKELVRTISIQLDV